MKKKGELTLNFIFIIFVSLIAVFVVVGLISQWAFKSGNFVSDLFQKDKPVEGIQIVELKECDNAPREIIKHITLCHKRGKDGLARGGLCYAIDATNADNGVNPLPCEIDSTQAQEITDAVEFLLPADNPFLVTWMVPYPPYEFDKIIIGYDAAENKVTVI